MALIELPGTSVSNTYATEAEFDAYHALRVPQISWALSASDAQKEAALRQAATLLDALFRWTGSPVDATQALTWPRDGMSTRNGFAIANTVVPNELKSAQSEFAAQMGAADLFSTGGGGSVVAQQNVNKVKAGSVEVGLGALNEETLDLALRMKSPEFAWSTDVVPQTVRNLLVTSWWESDAIADNTIIFGAM